MAERIVSPGVFTREKDLSFLPQGIGEIGAALVGQSIKGPAFVPTKVESFQEFQQVFGGLTEESYLPYTAQSYLEEAGTATIVRVLGSSGYTVETLNLIVSSSAGEKVAAVLHPTTKVLHADNANSINSLDNSVVVNLDESASAGYSTPVTASSFALHLSASGAIPVLSASAQLAVPTGSMNPTANNYIVNTFGYSPKNDGQYAYVYQEFSTFASSSFATGEEVRVSTSTSSVDYTKAYSHATTPYIISQDVSGVTKNLFRFHTLSHGNPTNYEFKIGIRDIKPASAVPGSEYGTFSVIVRRVDTSKIPNSVFGQTVQDSDTRPSIVEEFSGVNLDPNSPNYIKRVIGDKDIQIDANGKVILNGDYPNASKHIRVEVDSDVDSGANNSTLVPFGFAKLTSPLPSGVTLPAPSYNVSQSISNEYNKRAFLGYSYDFQLQIT